MHAFGLGLNLGAGGRSWCSRHGAGPELLAASEGFEAAAEPDFEVGTSASPPAGIFKASRSWSCSGVTTEATFLFLLATVSIESVEASVGLAGSGAASVTAGSGSGAGHCRAHIWNRISHLSWEMKLLILRWQGRNLRTMTSNKYCLCYFSH